MYNCKRGDNGDIFVRVELRYNGWIHNNEVWTGAREVQILFTPVQVDVDAGDTTMKASALMGILAVAAMPNEMVDLVKKKVV